MVEQIEQGLVIRGIGGLYCVETAPGVRIECRARGRLRRDGIQIMAGDHVCVVRQETGLAVIDAVLPRRNALQRPAVANIDTLVVIASAAPPVTQPFLIDKVSAIAGHKGIDILVCINKCDLQRGEAMADIYKKAGFEVLHLSAYTGEGIDVLRTRLKDGVFVLTGNSGVGKSSIINQLDPAWRAQTGAISEKIGRGRQTTRHIELYRLPGGAYIADTPGFSSFDIERMDLVLKDDLQHAFREFAQFIPQCRYRGCTHRTEQGCAVLQALAEGAISRSRYDSYQMLFDSMKDIHTWELKKENR
jgi:ribosome biogenesis GTPase